MISSIFHLFDSVFFIWGTYHDSIVQSFYSPFTEKQKQTKNKKTKNKTENLTFPFEVIRESQEVSEKCLVSLLASGLFCETI